MYPVVKVKSIQNDTILNELIDVISNFSSSMYFSNHLGKSQPKQKEIVSKFQTSLFHKLESISNIKIKWELEKPMPPQKDAVDIYGEGKDFVVVIELDKYRADQVAKKFVSRIALVPNKKVYYLSVCYPGTRSMNLNECIKYFGYCANLSKRMKGAYAGLNIEKI